MSASLKLRRFCIKPIVVALNFMLISPTAFSIDVQDQNKKMALDGRYLGQPVPGMTPEVFASEIISSEHVDLSGFFSPDFSEYYFTRVGGKYENFVLIKWQRLDGRWKESPGLRR